MGDIWILDKKKSFVNIQVVFKVMKEGYKGENVNRNGSQII